MRRLILAALFAILSAAALATAGEFVPLNDRYTIELFDGWTIVDDFADSPYYRAFVTFGRYCVNIRAISPEHYVKWLLDNNKKIDRWARDTYYDQYLSQRLLEEPVEQALARGIEFAVDWAEENASRSQDFFRYSNANRVMYAITTGRISAWIIYNCASGQAFLDELDSDSVITLWPYIDSDRWQRKFVNYPADREYCREILAQAGW